MTSTPVTELKTMLTNVTKPNTAGSRMNPIGDSFSQVMDRAGSDTKGKDTTPAADRKSFNERTDTAISKVSNDRRTDMTSKSAKETDDAQSVQETKPVEDAEVMEEEVMEAVQDIVEAVAKELNVSEEDVLKAMEALGMSWMDILNPDNMAQLVLQISGEPDMLNLLTNEGLYNSVQNLTEIVNTEVTSLQETLSMNDVEFGQFMNELKETAEVQQPAQPNDTAKPEENEPVIEIEVTQESKQTDAEDEVKPMSGQEVTTETEGQPETLVKEVTKSGQSENHETGHQEAKGEHAQTGQQQTTVAQPVNPNAAGQVTAPEQPFTPFAQPETQQIMKQIMDYMKINVTPELSEMELQLHPESLGNVRVQLASKDGVVTAQFKAESEIVKSAIESQMIQLRDSLNEKGVKVEAIEVTVESHAFERNLEQGNSNENGDYSEEPKKKSTRRINLNSINGVEELLVEEMEDGERIAAEMMAHAGNTVDFTA